MLSDFNEILTEDSQQYLEILNRYSNISSQDGEELFNLKTESLVLADRWSEIEASAKKAKSMDKIDTFVITDFKKWAYHRYQILRNIHEDCRAMWRSLNEQELFFDRNR